MLKLPRILAFAIAMSVPAYGAAQQVGEGDFAHVSELSELGYTPFAVSGNGSAAFGMRREQELFLCFFADNAELAAVRRKVIGAVFKDPNASRRLPNVPVVCVQAE